MKFYRTHVLVASDAKSLVLGAKSIQDLLVVALKKHNLEDEIKVIPTGSLGFEETGIAIMVYPESIIYAPVTYENVEEIVVEHFLKGRVVEHLKKTPKISHISAGSYKNQAILEVQERVVLENVGIIDPENIVEYIAREGYSAIEKALFDSKPENIIEELKTSELRGRGGAGFPTGLKWEFTRKATGDKKYVICNADEGEPGTFKDREIMEGDPHKLIEGMMIAGYATGSDYGFIYIRGEYALSIKRLEKAIADARAYGLLGDNILNSGFNFDLEVFKGAGAYVCGEETALIESIEGKRGEPRKKPPYPPTSGLWGKPTVVNNVETLANIPSIVRNGGLWYKGIGVEGSRGTKLFSLMGDLNWKGVVEIPFGTHLSDIITNLGLGIINGKSLKGVILGGSSGFLIKPDELETQVDFHSLAQIEAGPGSGSIVAMDEHRCIVDMIKNIAQFFEHESCGKCTPCRNGTNQIVTILENISSGDGKIDDLRKLEVLGNTMTQTSFCPLGQTAPNIMLQAIKKYRSEFEAHISDKKCPAQICSFYEDTLIEEQK